MRESVLTWERLEIGTGIMKYCTYALFAKLELSENNGRNVKGRTRLEEGDEASLCEEIKETTIVERGRKDKLTCGCRN